MLSKDIERIEREETMRQDADWQRQLKEAAKAPAPATMHEFAVSEASQDLGRYGAAMGKPHVTGSAAIVRYPQASGPWQGPDPVSDEPPLNYSVDAMPENEPSMSPSVEGTGPTSDGNAPSSVIPSDDEQRIQDVGPLSNDGGDADGAI